jgi:hypothetical protein
MEPTTGPLERVLRTLRECPGVIVARLLSAEEKQVLLALESTVEEKVVFGMCKSRNEGVRAALDMEFTVAMVIQSASFPYPHHPHIRMQCNDQVVGELVTDAAHLEELKTSRQNFFLWDNFVVYMPRLPTDPTARRNLRIIYPPREALQLHGLPRVTNSVFGTPSTEGDALIKSLLAIPADDGAIGTGLVGFTLAR